MAFTDDGLIYGLAKVTLGSDILGYIDEQGLQPAGTAAQRKDVYAAQVKDGHVLSIMSNPGKKAFKMNLIQLDGAGLVKAIGGTVDTTTGKYSPPEGAWEKTDTMKIECDSGHIIDIAKARVSADDFTNGINSGNVLGLSLNIECLKPATGDRINITPPQTV